MHAPTQKDGKQARNTLRKTLSQQKEPKNNLQSTQRLKIVLKAKAGHVRGGHAFH